MQNLLDKLKGGDGAVAAMLWIGLGIIILIVVIVIAMWIIRTLRPTLNMSGSSSRGARPQRLAVTDAFNLDRDGRKLIIVRRDNTEHLLLIGGPNDVVVESNIQRSERAARGRGEETVFPGELPLAAEPMRTTQPPAPVAPPPVAPPAPQRPTAAPSPASMAPPRQPAPVAPVPPAAPVVRPAPVAPPQPAMRAPEPLRVQDPAPVRVEPQRPPPPAPAVPVPSPLPPKFDDEFERALASMIEAKPITTAAPTRAVTPPGTTQPPPVMAAPVAPPLSPPQPAQAPKIEVSTPAPSIEPSPMQPVVARGEPPRIEPARSEPMSEMARRLNEVLQKPITPRPAPSAPVAPRPAPAPAPAPARAAPPAPAPAKPVGTIESEMDLLEEEMARLLGRPGTPGKT